VAEGLSAEIINCDSRQVYRRMDIGTAKPTSSERARVAHHCLDLVEPDQSFNAADFGRFAREAVASCLERGLWPLVVGGSGLYLRAMVNGLFPGPSADLEIRTRLKAEAEALGREALHKRLSQVDPEASEAIHPHDLVRLVRALEVFELTGEPISGLQKRDAERPKTFRLVAVGLSWPSEELAQRIRVRVRAMLEMGLAEEARSLLEEGLLQEIPSMQGIGYRQMGDYLAGDSTLEEAEAAIIKETRLYAKRQMTWFRKLQEIEWLKATDEVEADVASALASLRRRLPPLPSPRWASIIRTEVAAASGGG
jgi:tRNA dimethylallyltransferase